MEEKQIKAVVFDVGGTLLTFQATEEADRMYITHTMAYLNQHGILLGADPDEVMKHIEAGAKRYKRFTEEDLIELDCDTIWRDYMLSGFDIPSEQLTGMGETLSFLYDMEKRELAPREGLRETLTALRDRGYRLAIISNVMSTTYIPHFLRENGISEFFEDIQMSSLCRIRKPRPEIFGRSLAALGLTKEEVVYVGDTISRDIRGARAAGWPIIQIDNPAAYHRDTAFVGQFPPDARIEKLEELVGLLDAWPPACMRQENREKLERRCNLE